MLVQETTAAAESENVAPLTLRLFGPFEVRLHGNAPSRLRTRKEQWLLALLTLRPGHEVERSWLAGTLWPDSSEAAAYASLRNCLKDLRRAMGLEADRLRSPTSRTLALNLEDADVDVIAFDQAIAQGEAAALERAVGLYRGPLLEECAEEWVVPARLAREQACLSVLETLAERTLERGDLATAERWLRRAVAIDPLRETAQRTLMQALAAGGNYAAATQVYRELRLRLHRELNTTPDPETQALYQQLRTRAREKAGVGRPGTRVAGGYPLGAGVGAQPSDTRHRSPATRVPANTLPEGTVTFLFTDIEGSSQLWEQYPEAMGEALQQHDALLRQSIQAYGGHVFKTVGDAFYAAFAIAPAALAAALAAQQALLAETWGQERSDARGGPLCVRMALHTGIAEAREGDYFGPTLNRVARLLEAGHGSQVLLSLPAEELVRDELPEGASLRPLGEHRLRDLVRPEQVFQLLHPDLPADFPPLRCLAAFAHNLPLQLTSFVGREREIEQVKQWLLTTPVLTLTGPGGCGKTRLALQVAADLLGGSEAPGADGVWLVELAALAEPALVPQTVAAALGVPEQPGRPLTTTLIEHLRTRALLLVLDNCEHLLAACGELVDTLLRACPRVRILATSRERLGLTGERVYLVPSLSVPDPGQLPSLERLQQFEAVQLFADRATLSQPAFAVTEANAPAVAQLCQRLDGIPLALELAAARVKALPVESIAERLGSRFRLLTGGSRTALPRQQTLRALIDWSYDLLSESERRLLCRLSVFAGGWMLEAAEGVCAGDGIEAWETLDLLTQLVEKSLVAYEEQEGEARYRLLETVRQYAWDRLLESGEGEEVRGRHRDWFVQLVEQAEPELEGAHQQEWLERLDQEYDNLRAGLEWGWESEPVSALRLAAALGWFWQIRGHWSEGWEALERGLERSREAPGEVRWKALDWAGEMASRCGENGRAKELHEMCLALSRQLGDKRGIARSLNMLGCLAWQRGDYQMARALFEENLLLWRELGDQLRMTYSLGNLGVMALEQGDYAAARALLEETLEINRAIGNQRFQAVSLNCLGWLAQHQGDDEAARACFGESLAISRQIGAKDSLAEALAGLGWLACSQASYEAARRLLEESLAISRELGDKRGIFGSLNTLGWAARVHRDWESVRALHKDSPAVTRDVEDQSQTGWALQGLGDLAAARGQYVRARALFQQGLAIWRQQGARREIAIALEKLANVAAAQGAAERAGRLFGAASAVRETTSTSLPSAERAEDDRAVTAARATLGDAAFAATWEEGRTMPLEQAIAYALEKKVAA